MVKFTDYAVTFSEVPDEMSLTFSISNCQGKCVGCHSAHLRQDIGDSLIEKLPLLLKKFQSQITCVCFLGEGNDKEELQECIDYVKFHGLKTCLYCGREASFDEYKNLDYLKTGQYIEACGGLDKKTTNQKMFYHQQDITYKFWPRSEL